MGSYNLLRLVFCILQINSTFCAGLSQAQRVLFDCTRVINDLLNNRTTPNDKAWLQQILNETSTIYYESEDKIEDLFPEKFSNISEHLERLGWKLGSSVKGKETSILLSIGINKNINFIKASSSFKNKFQFNLPSTNNSRPPLKILFSWRPNEPFTPLEKFHLYLPSKILRENFNTSNFPDVGIEYAEAHIGRHLFRPDRNFDVVSVSVQFVAGQRLPESYEMFREHMNSIVDRNKQYLRRNGAASLCFRILLNHTAHPNLHMVNQYVILLSRFASKWASESGHSVMIEMSQVSVSNFNLKTALVPTLRGTVIPIFNSILCAYRDFDFKTMLKLVATRFNTAYVDRDDLLDFCKPKKNVLLANHTDPSSSPNFLLHLKTPSTSDSTLEILPQQLQNKVGTVVLNFDTYKDAELIRRLSNLTGQIGCNVVFEDLSDISNSSTEFVKVVEKKCRLFKFPQNNPVLLEIKNPLDHNYQSTHEDIFSDSFYISRVQPKLFDVVLGAAHLQREYPSIKNMILKMPDKLSHHIEDNLELRVDSYCNDNIRKLNRLVEAVATWSYIHNIRVVIKSAVNSDWSPYRGWWDPIKANGIGGYNYTTKFLMRNYPDTMPSVEKDPCLVRFERVPKDIIPLDKNRMGCRIHLKEKGEGELLLERELETLMSFASHEFSNVEIIGAQFEQVDVIVSALEKSVSFSDNLTIFIDFSVKNTNLGHWNVEMQKVAEVLNQRNLGGNVRIELSDWEHLTEEPLPLEGFQKLTQSVNVGLVINNCTEVLQAQCHVLAKIEIFGLKFSHFVCREPVLKDFVQSDESGLLHSSILSSSDNYFRNMSLFLDAQLLKKLEFGERFPGKEIFIRVEVQASTVENYLRAIRDVNQHADLYKIKYFPINAFSLGKHNPAEPFRWWSIQNKSDLLNVSNYFQIGSEYSGIRMWRPSQNVYVEGKPGESKVNWFVIAVSVGLIAVTVLVAWRVSRRTFLTRAEELEFIRGAPPGSTENNYMKMGFDKSYEIPKVNLLSEETKILGSGNFGTVYKALVKKKWVAVKVPQVDAGKPSFKATLQEIKVLCYVGNHQNVLGFVGAYTKEILKGVVQIATELCENGELLSCLQGISKSLAGIQRSGSLDDFVATFDLERFCYEIAAGMDYLSSKQVIHGDLATRNVLLDEHYICKIGDFGLSRKLYEYETYVKESKEPLPWKWMAHESLRKLEFSTKSDVWSFGVTLWEIYSLGDVPYAGLNWTVNFADQLSEGLRLQRPRFSTKEIHGKMLECWTLQAELRPTFAELCEFFLTYRDSVMEKNLINQEADKT